MTRVLVVDDKPENIYYLTALLGGHGYTVASAHDGEQALALAQRESPDLVITDLLMPVMDGYTLLKHWKADPRLATIPFIVYTATYTEPEDEQLARDLGADAFILKPAEPDDFLSRIRAVQGGVATPHPKTGPPDTAEHELLKIYNQSLVRKLEDKMLQLEQVNQTLERDLAARQAAEAALRNSEERFRLLAKATNDAIWDWDLTHDAWWWSEGYETLFGHSRVVTEPSLACWSQHIDPEDRERVVEVVRQTIAGGGDRWAEQYRYQRRDGGFADVEDRGHVLRDATGTAIRIVGGLTDITSRMALETQLRQSQRLESVGQLTGGVAHDFNNLLTVILGSAELLVERATDDKQRTLATMVSSAAQRGAELTRRLLAFSRKQTLHASSLDLNRQVADFDPLLRRTLGAHIEIEFVRGGELWPALVDPGQLESALLNLCLNSRDAMPDGGRLTIETANRHLDQEYADRHPYVQPGDYVMLAVTDTGAGIPPEQLGRVFEPFFTTKEEGKGTGLGLAMVYGFVKQSGGHISIYSEPGDGTTVKLYLPRASVRAGKSDETDGGAAEQTADARSGTDAPASILLVEDDELVRRYAGQQLRGLGYHVLEARDATCALDIIRSDAPIDLLFTDVVMPGLSGRELVDEARRQRPDLRVLYTSGYPQNAYARHGKPEPGMRLLGKPYRRAELADAVRGALAASLTSS